MSSDLDPPSRPLSGSHERVAAAAGSVRPEEVAEVNPRNVRSRGLIFIRFLVVAGVLAAGGVAAWRYTHMPDVDPPSRPAAPAGPVRHDDDSPLSLAFEELGARAWVPTEAPPDLVSVELRVVDEEQVLVVRHSTVQIVVCAEGPCGVDGEVPITRVVGNTARLAVVAAPLSKDAGPVVVPAEVERFWTTTTWQRDRPDWLVDDLSPAVTAPG